MGDIDSALEEIDISRTIPYAENFGMSMRNGEPTPRFPILVIVNKELWELSKSVIRMSLDFLKRLMGFAEDGSLVVPIGDVVNI
ncbi:hypothetical protein SUGI_0486310 [Cryptomeria japonica]|nr:hypothetical protein SUGI_0486310 [Cryptomeria japonica]